MNECIQFAGIIVTILGSCLFLWNEMKNMESRIDKQSDRADKLYEMYCEMQKDYNQKFYDILKEGRK
jgi:hypothetical protein